MNVPESHRMIYPDTVKVGRFMFGVFTRAIFKNSCRLRVIVGLQGHHTGKLNESPSDHSSRLLPVQLPLSLDQLCMTEGLPISKIPRMAKSEKEMRPSCSCHRGEGVAGA